MAERDENEDFNEESAKDDEDLETDGESILAALNFVLILASLSSPDPGVQRLNLEGIEERESGSWNQRGSRNSGSRSDFPARSQQVSGFSRGALERQQNFKVQAKIRDCRHSRRL